LVYNDLLRKADQLINHIQKGLPVLSICGAYQLLGQYYKALDGEVLKGLGFFDFHTVSKPGRLIGNVLIEIRFHDQNHTVVGFENHGGRTYFEGGQLEPLGKVIKGFGNNGEDRYEGIHYHNLIGTYLHGPLLPKNPVLADYFIRVMAERRGIEITAVLDDRIENLAHQQVEKKILTGRQE
jgi:lipid II isoglutaminyl synthase (glutamine-hydrolysing)